MLGKSRRNYILTAVLVIFGLLFSSSEIYARKMTQSNNSLKEKKVLFIYGGWEGHEPKQSVDVFVPWLKSEGAEVTISDNLDSYLDEELMGSVDLIIQTWTMGTITNEQERGLLKAIRNGAGLAGWHGGIGDSFRNNPEYQFMVGGQWVAHPGGVIDYSVNITDKEDPVTKGLNDFEMHSEQYYMHIDPNVKVLATTEFTSEHSLWIDDCVMPVVWKKYYGNGRVFYSSLGHVMTDFEVQEALEIMKRGIRWAAESKYAPKEKWVSPVYK
nr:ThuA domain-containing protein [uncultured Draconibacterium sp.]